MGSETHEEKVRKLQPRRRETLERLNAHDATPFASGICQPGGGDI
jgi:hypothetical protein